MTKENLSGSNIISFGLSLPFLCGLDVQANRLLNGLSVGVSKVLPAFLQFMIKFDRDLDRAQAVFWFWCHSCTRFLLQKGEVRSIIRVHDMRGKRSWEMLLNATLFDDADPKNEPAWLVQAAPKSFSPRLRKTVFCGPEDAARERYEVLRAGFKGRGEVLLISPDGETQAYLAC